MNKKNKKSINWFLVASICYCISSILLFFTKENTNMAVTNLCLGSCFFCLSQTNDKKK